MSVGAVNKQTGERIPTAGLPAVDSVLSGTSTNPVQNRVVKEALDGIKDGQSINSFADVETALSSKQNKLTFDDTPTDGSNNPVKSNGIYDSEKDIYAAMGEMGAKNLIPYPYTDTTKTTNGITYTDNGDGTITANGTALDTANFILADEFTFTENESYILTGCPNGGSANTYRQYMVTYGGDVGEGKRITPTSESGLTKQFLIQIFAGTTVSNLTFKPMLRLASDTDNTYQPYAKTNKQLTDDVALKQDKYDTITYAQWQALTPEQQAAKDYYISDYPSSVLTAGNISYDNTTSGMTANKVQGAIDELKSGINDLTASKYGTTVSLLPYTEDTYTFPNDGYIILSTDAASTVDVRVYGTTGNTYFTMKALNDVDISLFVKKGMRALVSSTTGTGANARYFPLIV